MKKHSCRTVLRITALVLIGILLTGTALAGTSTEGVATYTGSGSSRLSELIPFKFYNHKYGIGYGSCPVYTAPSLDAYRCANGKAVCDTNHAMADGGFVSGWLMVRYETNDGGYRVGYIPPKYVRDFKSHMAPHFQHIAAVADDVIMVTDNPKLHNTSFGMLEAGEEFYLLSRYDYWKKDGFDWWYIECTIDGQMAYGFIEVDQSRFHVSGY